MNDFPEIEMDSGKGVHGGQGYFQKYSGTERFIFEFEKERRQRVFKLIMGQTDFSKLKVEGVFISGLYAWSREDRVLDHVPVIL